MHKAILYEKKESNSVKCTACNNYCVIKENDTGICGVRKNVSGDLYLLVYGKAAAAHVDPIEKKPLFHFLPGSKIFSVGTIGCNFGCEFCQNWNISQAIKKAKKNKETEKFNSFFEDGQDMPPEKIIRICKQKNIPSIAFTYNEPTIFFEYTLDTMKLAKKEGIKTVFVSNGYESIEALEKLKGYLDAINIDLKSFNPEFYKKHCHAKLEPVLETIKKAYSFGIWVEITTLIIPGENDSDEELKKIAEFIASIDKNIPWHVSAFYPEYNMLNKESTSKETLLRAYDIGKEKLNYVYVGNISDIERTSTYCPNCKSLLIKRKINDAEIRQMKNGACAKCATKIKGVFE